jgi:hypothetical protein
MEPIISEHDGSQDWIGRADGQTAVHFLDVDRVEHDETSHA